MGGTVQTGTTTTGVNNPDLNATISKLAKGISSEYTPGKSLYVAPGQTTQQGWGSSLAAALNPDYASGIGGAITDLGQVAAGNRFGTNDPGYAALRSKLQSDVTGSVNNSFNQSGLFGSDSNVKGLTEGLTGALGGLDYQNYQNDVARQQAAAAMLPQLFAGAQLPASIQQSVGASQDAAAQGAANGPTDYLAKLTGIINGASGAAGTTSSKELPLWQLLLGTAATAAGSYAGAK